MSRVAVHVGTIARRIVVAVASARRELLSRGGGLYLVLTSPVIPHVELAAAACERGVPVLQLREKSIRDEEFLGLALEILDITRGTDTLLIINDRVDIALAAGADGIHVGQSDASVTSARDAVGRDALVGVSASTTREAELAGNAGADYVGIGPVFPTDTKPDALPPIGLDGLRSVAAAVPRMPSVAIGGITGPRAADVLAAGAQYVAVISAVCHADDPIGALDAFLSGIAEPGEPPDETTGGR